jgi:antitoxin component YwqK of YwqJK toxin-antitoxin module
LEGEYLSYYENGNINEKYYYIDGVKLEEGRRIFGILPQ